MTENMNTPEVSTCVEDASTRSFIPNPTDSQKVIPANDTDRPYSWFPMYVRYRKELEVKAIMDTNDFRTFIPMETCHVKRGASVRAEERPAIHNLLFVYSFKERITWMKMYNRACQNLQYMSRHHLDGSSEVITVSEQAMDNLIRASRVDDPDGQRSYTDRPLSITDLDRRIKFTSGPFLGIEGIIKRIDGNRAMVIPVAEGISMKITITRASEIEFL